MHAVLREKKINWSSTDIVRIGYADQHWDDVILWIGVRLDSSVSYEVAIDAALHCKSLVIAYGISDVEVEMRKADVFRHTGPQSFHLASTSNSTRLTKPLPEYLFSPYALG